MSLAPGSTGSAPDGKRLQPLRVRLVEDNPDDQHLAQLAFSRLERKVELQFSEDGEEALADLRSAFAMGEPLPHLALVDVSMPRLGGIDFLKRLRADPNLAPTIVVVFTTSTAERDVRACYEAGCNAYVVKPYSLKSLVDVLERITSFWEIASRWGH